MPFKVTFRFVVFWLCCTTFQLFAQQDEIISRYYSMKDGLSNDAALCLLQDSKGFLWIGTYTGLNKFDGYHFTTYPDNPLDSNSLASNSINCLWEDQYQRLWVGTASGLKLIDLNTEKVYPLVVDSLSPRKGFDMPTNRIRKRKDGRLWICTSQGIYLADPQTLSITSVINSGDDADRNSYFDIAEAYDGTIWAASGKGLVHFNTHFNETMRYVHDSHDPRSLAANIVKSVFVDSQKRVWAGTQYGLDLFNSKHKSFSHFSFDKFQKVIPNIEVQAIVENPDGKFWIGSMHGLDVFDPNTGSFELLVDQFVWSILEDKQKIRWIGTAHGVYQISPPGKKFNTVRKFGPASVADARVFTEDNNRDIWIAVHNPGYQLFRYSPSSERFFQYVHDPLNPYSFSGNSIRAIIPENEEGLWIASYFKLHKFNFKRQNFSSIDLTFEPSALFKDSKGSLWLGGWSSVGIFDLSTKTHKALADFPRIEVKSIIEDRYQNIWIASIDGLFRYSLNTGRLDVFKNDPADAQSLSHNRIQHLMIDQTGTLWLGTSGGINKMIPGTEKGKPKFMHWRTTNSNLPHDEILSVIDGRDGTIWMGSGNRISHFFPHSGEFRNYDHSDGLHGQLIYRGLRSERGEIYFSSRDGLIVFHPDSLRDNPYIPPVAITSFSIANVAVPLRGSYGDTLSWKTRLANAIPYTKEFTLTHQQNDFTLEFTALNYIHQEKNQYKYRLEPYETEWIETTASNRIARYTNISPGKYTFRVIGSNNDGVWNEVGATLRITIMPPWWQTWWAYSLYAVTFIVMLLVWRNYENKRLILKHRAEHLSEVDNLKSRFFANISHEFRTPITLILGPLKEMYNGTFSGDRKSALAVMIRNSQRLLQLINQLLDLSKLEVGKMALRTVPIDLVQFLREVASSYESLAAEKKIKYFFNHDLQTLTVYVDAEKLEKVVHNLLSNAFKFTSENGEVILNLGIQDKKWVAIKVIDTGIGIPTNQLDKIFDRFYQVDNSQTRKYEGSGLGMALAKELATLHHGRINVESAAGKGSTFTVLLPLGNEHLEKDEIGHFYIENEPKEILEIVNEPSDIAAENPVEAPEASDLQPIILIVEDNRDMRDYIRKTLSVHYRIITAENGKEGVLKASESIPDAIISDVMMPEMDGYKLCEIIKGSELTNHIPVILLTAKADHDSKLVGLETGADDYLPKPFDADELKLIVRNHIEARNKMKERFSREVTLEPREISITSFDEKFLNKVLATIEQHMDDESFSVDALSRDVGYSNMHLYRKLKALTGQTPSQFLRTIRLKRAAALLAKDSDNVTQIAYSVGFSSLSYFNKCFKEQFGVTPGKFAELQQD